MKIKKVSGTSVTQAQVVDGYSASTKDSYSCNYVNNAVKDIYSETETKTNKIWIDNKPIYRKVYKFTNPSSSSPSYDLDITNLGEVTHIGFIGDYNYNNYKYRRESTYFASNDYMNCFIRDDTIQIRFESNFRAGINTLYVIVEYTKSS